MSKKDRQQRKKKRRQERLRQEKHLRQSSSFTQNDRPKWMDQPGDPDLDVLDKDDVDYDDESSPMMHAELGGAPNLGSPFIMERMLRKMHHAMKGKDFGSATEMNAYLNANFTGKLDINPSKVDDPKEQAQELAFQAMESVDEMEVARLAGEALKLDPDCVDAMVQLIPLKAGDDHKKHLELLEQAVEAGRRALGGEYFNKNRGKFWGLVETRPFLRALSDLGHTNFFLKNHKQAIACFEEVLLLNPGDNQGVRHPLLGSAFATSKIDLARRVLVQYGDEDSAMINWSKVLERFLSLDAEGAARTLKKALKQNPHVAAILLGLQRLPGSKDYISAGSPSEAREIFMYLGRAWIEHSLALDWLREQCSDQIV